MTDFLSPQKELSESPLKRYYSKDSLARSSKDSNASNYEKEGRSSVSTVRELPAIRRCFGMYYAFPTTKSGLWKEETLPEEVMAELRRENAPAQSDAITSSVREKQREVARRKSLQEAEQFEVVRRKSKELSEKMAEDIAAMKDSKWNLVRQAGSSIIGK
jgi:ribosomal protein RSM22 (predicted rRNA methylase)